MTDITNQTARFAFQKIGGAQVREPRDENAILDAIDAQLNETPHPSTDFTLGSGVALTFERPQATRRMRLTLTNAVLTMAGATTSCVSAFQLVKFPATRNISIVGCRANLSCKKDGTTLLAADTPAVSFGTAAAALSDLSTANDKNVIANANLAGTLTATFQGSHALTAPLYVAKGASNYLYLNVGLSAKATGTLTVSGTVDIFYDDFGNFSDYDT